MLAEKLAGSGAAAKTYVEDVFSTYTFNGTSGAQSFTTGLDFSTYGGMQHLKSRTNTATTNGNNHVVTSSALAGTFLETDATAAAGGLGGLLTLGSSGFSVSGSDSRLNNASNTYVGWGWRNAPKFFKSTTVTKTAGSNATVDLSTLGTVGMVKVKRTDSTGSWYVWHRSLTADKLLIGETTAAEATLGHITVSGTTLTLVNGVIADGTYHVEAYAHDTSSDGLIQCGSFTTDASGNATVTLGWEPQLVDIKATSAVSSWMRADTMRGFTATTGTNTVLYLNSSGADDPGNTVPGQPTATGFKATVSTNTTYIFVAIRRGPMKPPTSGTQVYNANTSSAVAGTALTTGFPVDLQIQRARTVTDASVWVDRLRGVNTTDTTALLPYLRSDGTAAETNGSGKSRDWGMNGFDIPADLGGVSSIYHSFRRYPGVFDEVCFTAATGNDTFNHNLTVAPELVIFKRRSGVEDWYVKTSSQLLRLNTTAAAAADTTLAPTSTTATLFGGFVGSTYVAYLFATLPGISKCGSYTGNGTSQTVNCGFAAGARFVMIKRTDAVSNWYVYDTVRGINVGTDPFLALNSTTAETTSANYIEPDATGFALTSQLLNTSGGTYIYLAFA